MRLSYWILTAAARTISATFGRKRDVAHAVGNLLPVGQSIGDEFAQKLRFGRICFP